MGDSKAWLLRGDTLLRLTRDHTIVEEMRRIGLVDQARADRHSHRHLLIRTIGGGGDRVHRRTRTGAADVTI